MFSNIKLTKNVYNLLLFFLILICNFFLFCFIFDQQTLLFKNLDKMHFLFQNFLNSKIVDN